MNTSLIFAKFRVRGLIRNWSTRSIFALREEIFSLQFVQGALHLRKMLFFAGRRKCIGETLAKRNVFLFLCIILHKFKIEPSTSNTSVDILGGFTQVPAPFEVKFIPRTNWWIILSSLLMMISRGGAAPHVQREKTDMH